MVRWSLNQRPDFLMCWASHKASKSGLFRSLGVQAGVFRSHLYGVQVHRQEPGNCVLITHLATTVTEQMLKTEFKQNYKWSFLGRISAPGYHRAGSKYLRGGFKPSVGVWVYPWNPGRPWGWGNFSRCCTQYSVVVTALFSNTGQV